MRLISVSAKNFGSYADISFNFENKGLTCISGPTGSGKSTLFDLVPWALFGRTAKNGAVDDVLGWGSTQTEATLTLEHSGKIYEVTRARGKRSDLYFSTNGVITRGKDLTDTHNLLSKELNLTPDMYLNASYFHEFSQAASFFTASAKIRRHITEQIVDLSEPKKVKESASEYKSVLKAELADLDKSIALLKNDIKHLSTKAKEEDYRHGIWEKNKQHKLVELLEKSDKFLKEKNKSIEKLYEDLVNLELECGLERLNIEKEIKSDQELQDQLNDVRHKKEHLGEDTCKECGAKKSDSVKLLLIKEEYSITSLIEKNITLRQQIQQINNRFKSLSTKYNRDIETEIARENLYLNEITKLKCQENPHDPEKAKAELKTAETKLKSLLLEIEDMSVELADTTLLIDITDTYRAHLISDTINNLQNRSNDLLSRYFDGELVVNFTAEESDKLELDVYKDGNLCSYAQLSKGQRHMLKLCLGVSMMTTISHYSGVSLNSIFLDEVAEGLDESTKVKVYGLLKELSEQYENVFAIDHSEALKSMFDNKINIIHENGHSICLP